MDYQNFVFKLKPEHIDNLLLDVQLLSEKYDFAYAIDTYDIINYCLPYTDNLFSDPKYRNYFAQRVIAYSNFFKSNVSKTYLCKEYQEEIKSVSERIRQDQIVIMSELDENISSILKLLKKDSLVSDEEYDTKIKKNLELVITMLILDQEYSPESKERYFFIKESFRQFKLEGQLYEDDDTILNRLSETSENPLVPVVFKSFVDDIAPSLISVGERSSRYHYLDTTYTDIEVICRLAEVNRKLAEGKEKKVIVYLSSAPKKTQQIFTILNRISGEGIGLPHISQFKKYNFQRNIFQIFLLRNLTEKFPGKSDFIKTVLILIKKIIIQIEKIKQHSKERESDEEIEKKILEKFSDVEKKEYDSVKDLLTSISVKIENHFYYDIFLEFFGKTNLDNIDNDKLELLKKASAIIKVEETSLSNIIDLIHNLSRFTSTQTLLNWFFTSKTSDIRLNVHHGKDIIRNSFNHLPYLVFYKQPEKNIASEMFKITSLVASDVDLTENKSLIIAYFKKIINIIDFSSRLADEKLNSAIVISWLNLISGHGDEKHPDSKNQHHNINEEHIILFLFRFSQIYESLSLTPYLYEQNNIIKLKFERDTINSDIGYLLLWFLRRNKRFGECKDLGKRLVEQYADDPRMHHGLALCSISEFYDQKKKTKVTETETESIELPNTTYLLVIDSINYLKTSLEIYNRDFQAEGLNADLKNLIVKSILSILNSLTDMHLRLYLYENDFSILKIARKYLIEMKELFEKNGLVYNDYPIPNYTEAELEYHETLYYFKKGDITKSSVKILHATNRAYQVKEKHTRMDDLFKEIIVEIDSLRIKIFKELKII